MAAGCLWLVWRKDSPNNAKQARSDRRKVWVQGPWASRRSHGDAGSSCSPAWLPCSRASTINRHWSRTASSATGSYVS